MHRRVSPRTPLLAALLLLTFAVPAVAQTDWAVAARKDAQITTLVGRLLPFAESVEGAADADGVILYDQSIVKAEENKHSHCTNRIFLVRDLASFPDRFLKPGVAAEDRVDRAMGFIVRDGAIVARLEPTYESGPDEIGEERAVFDWSEVKSGDVIGWSLVETQKSPYPGILVRLADVFPAVYIQASIDGGEKLSYEARWWAVDSDEVKVEETAKRDGRAVGLKLDARGRAAAAEVSDEFPLSYDVPHALLVLDEIYFEPEGEAAGFLLPGWAPARGWNSVAIQNASIVEALAEDASDMGIMLTAITTAKTTAHAKAAAITDWVRKTIEREEGDLIRDGAMREDLTERMSTKKGTEQEIFMLAAVMMKKAGVPVSVASFRDPSLGEIDESWEHGLQLTDAVLRVEDAGVVRYYAPQCEECEPGTIPAEWVGAKALVYDAGLADEVETYSDKRQKEAMAGGQIDVAEMQREVEAQDWTRFETLTVNE